jgi:predicted amidohydrolase
MNARPSAAHMSSSLRIAAAQFPVSGNIARNAHYIGAQIKEAVRQGANVVHFPETALSGYAPQHFSSLHRSKRRLQPEFGKIDAKQKARATDPKLMRNNRPGQRGLNHVNASAP